MFTSWLPTEQTECKEMYAVTILAFSSEFDPYEQPEDSPRSYFQAQKRM